MSAKFIKQAQAEEKKAMLDWKRDPLGWAPTETQSNVLYVCGKLEIEPRKFVKGVYAVASSPTKTDFDSFITPRNILLLSEKYQATGFVVKRTVNKKVEWKYVGDKKASR